MQTSTTPRWAPKSGPTATDSESPCARRVVGSGGGGWDQGGGGGVRAGEGGLQVREQVLLMTGALGQWFRVEAEVGGRPWAALARAATPEAFGAFVDCLRGGGALRN